MSFSPQSLCPDGRTAEWIERIAVLSVAAKSKRKKEREEERVNLLLATKSTRTRLVPEHCVLCVCLYGERISGKGQEESDES